MELEDAKKAVRKLMEEKEKIERALDAQKVVLNAVINVFNLINDLLIFVSMMINMFDD